MHIRSQMLLRVHIIFYARFFEKLLIFEYLYDMISTHTKTIREDGL